MEENHELIEKQFNSILKKNDKKDSKEAGFAKNIPKQMPVYKKF